MNTDLVNDYEIDDAAHWIGQKLRFWRVNVTQTKSKWGTARVYLFWGWSNFHSILYPGYAYRQYKSDLLWKLDCSSSVHWLFNKLNLLVYPLQKKLYRHYYKKALKRWPNLWEALLCGADYPELLKGLNSDFDRLQEESNDNA